MSITVTSHERAGVYSVYDASAVVSGSGVRTVALAAKTAGGTGTKVYRWVNAALCAADMGEGTEIAALAKLLFQNGAAEVCGVPVGSDYSAAFAAIEALEDVDIVVCDSTDLAVQQALRDSVKKCSEARMERIAVVAGSAGESVNDLRTRAAGLNSERVVLVSPGALGSDGSALDGVRCACAVAGAIAGSSDPAVPLGGAELVGLAGLGSRYGDDEIDALVRGGVTPLESIGGEISVVRGVTTRTTTGGVSDGTWRELTTILVVDEVIPGIRSSLRSKFRRAKNTAQGRGAVRAQVVLELEDRVDREIISGYDGVIVTALADNPTVCLVEFSFTVAHGLNQIWLSAHITV